MDCTFTLHNADCLSVLEGMPSESVDLVFSDPPFNVGVKYKGYKDNRADYYKWCAAWIAECFRVLKPTGTFYLMTITRHLPEMYPLMHKHGVFINQVNWRNVSGTNGKRSFWNEYQPIMVYGKSLAYKFHHLAQTRKSQWVRFGGYSTGPKGQMLDYWDDIPFVYAGSITHKEAVLTKGTNKKAHPAQMPIALPMRAILFSTDEGDTVYDPFTGSGSTAIACYRTNRNFVGSELSAEYCAIVRARVEREQLSPSFFNQHAPQPGVAGDSSSASLRTSA